MYVLTQLAYALILTGTLAQHAAACPWKDNWKNRLVAASAATALLVRVPAAFVVLLGTLAAWYFLQVYVDDCQACCKHARAALLPLAALGVLVQCGGAICVVRGLRGCDVCGV